MNLDNLLAKRSSKLGLTGIKAKAPIVKHAHLTAH